jgi:hypothetical protein
MTLEILDNGGARITATEQEVRTLAQNAELAAETGSSHAPFLTDDAVTEFVIQVEAS